MKLKFWIIVMLALVVTTGAKAQKNHLTAFTQENLPTEMLTYLDQATSDKEKKKDNAKLIMEFGTVYSQLDGAMQKRMTAVCNTVLKLKVRQHPDVFNFIGTVNLMYTKGGRTNFDAWVGCLEFIQGRNKKIKTELRKPTQGDVPMLGGGGRGLAPEEPKKKGYLDDIIQRRKF